MARRIGSNGLWCVLFIQLALLVAERGSQSRARGSRIGIDARMISHEKATLISNQLSSLDSKMIYPPQNLIDLVWKDKAAKSREPLFRQPIEFTGVFRHPEFQTRNSHFGRSRGIFQASEAAGMDQRAAAICPCVLEDTADRVADPCRHSPH
jgi:hypothetical protein